MNTDDNQPIRRTSDTFQIKKWFFFGGCVVELLGVIVVVCLVMTIKDEDIKVN
jgi:hypothetical protein